MKFNKDGKFKILMVADAQDTDTPQKDTIALYKKAVLVSNPDLVVFAGDNTNGKWKGVNEEKMKGAIAHLIEPLVQKNIPFAVVFGNHDHEGGVSREKQMEMFKEYPNCLAVNGPDITGCGNYNITIKDSQNRKAVFNLWFIDSNDYAKEGGYAYVQKDQIAWYEKTSNELKKTNEGKPLPSLLFQHIAVPEVYDLLLEVPKGTKGAVWGHGKNKGKRFVVNPNLVKQGKLRESPCSPEINNGQFASWEKQGDIVGAFFGHDHVNDFSGKVGGIWLTCCIGTGFYSYGNTHGVRTIELDENDLSGFKSDILYFEDLLNRKPRNPIVARHGYWEFKNRVVPAVLGATGALAVLGIAVKLLVKYLVK